MATQVQIRRDSASNLASVTPVAGEAGYDTTNKNLIVGDGSRLGGIPHASYSQIQAQRYTFASSVGGTADAITIALAEDLDAYAQGVVVEFEAASNNTGATTINVSSLGVKTIKKVSGGALSDLAANDIVSGCIYMLVYDGTYFQILNVSGSASGYKLIETVTVASQATVDFDSTKITGYKNYIFRFSGIKPSTDNAQFLTRFSVDGGSTYSSATAYITFGRLTTNTASAADVGGSASSAGLLTQSGNGVGTGTNESGLNGEMILENPTDTGYKSASVNVNYTNGTPTFIHFDGAIFTNTTPFTGDTIDGVRFLFNTGNIASGTISLYGSN